MDLTACPCCGNRTTECQGDKLGHCPCCAHRWRKADRPFDADYYGGLSGRNAVPAVQRARKLADRMATIAPLLRDGMRILEVGCAEGELGREIKAAAQVHYTGVEPSRDSERAADVLDRVVRDSQAIRKERFDLILSFHVLEHIADIAAELRRWRDMIEPSGTVVVEVPEEAGHRLLNTDANREHLHFFSASSLAALAGRAGFVVDELTARHFESPVYPDSLRLVARPRRDEAQRREALLEAFRSWLGGAFAVYGIGGDFANYVEPLINDLGVTALLDSDAARHGEKRGKHTLQGLDPARHATHPILVASVRFGEEIRDVLLSRGIPRSSIILLADIYDPRP